MKTKVIFRNLNGDIIALFPEILGTNDPYTCLNYMHLGQHGSGNASMEGTKPATMEQFQPLFSELTRLGYDIKISWKFTQKDLMTRKSQLPL